MMSNESPPNKEGSPSLTPGVMINQRYLIKTPVGKGGMGVVYQAYDGLLEREVAIKVLSELAVGEPGNAKLMREAQSAAQLNHPNVVSIFDAGEWGKSLYIVMEMVRGEPLSTGHGYSIKEILSIARQLCAALHHAHSQGIIHRDLKPENVIITSNGTVKLMDFGLARSIEASRLSSEGMIVGTVYYLAPEQALGEKVDGRTDLYSLGVLLYELVAGRLPFEGDDPLMVISQHLHTPAKPPSTYKQEVPASLDGLILNLLSKHPEDRMGSAGEVLEAIDRLLSLQLEGISAGERPLLQRLESTRLVGRKREFDEINYTWQRAISGEGQALLISGEPGVGKTRLAQEAVSAARLQGAHVLQGGCYENEAVNPYLPVTEALRDWTHSQPDEVLRNLPLQTAVEMAKLAPEIDVRIGPLQPNPALSPDLERMRLFDHLSRFLGSLAAQGGLLFFVDDLHWADPGSISFLHYLLRRLRGERLLLLGAYREIELDRAHPLASALVDWNRERLVTRIQVGRLDEKGCADLLAAMFGQNEVSPEFSQAIYNETEGNPFFIEEVVKALVDQGQIYLENGEWERLEIGELAIPQSIKEAIGRRLDRLSSKTVDVMHHAAFLGKSFLFDELASTSPSPGEDTLLDAIDEAIAAQLIRAGGADRFSFTHDKIREVLYEEQNPVRRRRLHQRIGEGLEKLYSGKETGAHIQDLAFHFLHSGDLHRALAYSLSAANSARKIYANDEAITYFQYAAECATALDLPDELGKVYKAIGELQADRWFVYPAIQSFQKALQFVKSEEERATLKTSIGAALTIVGDSQGLEYLCEAETFLDPDRHTRELAQNLTMQARFHHYHAQHAKAISVLERARLMAEPLDEPAILYNVYSFLAGAYQHLLQLEKSMDWAQKCVDLGQRKDFPAAKAAGFEFLAEDLALIGRWEDALKFAARDREIGEQIGSFGSIAWSKFVEELVNYSKGFLAEARACALSGLEVAEQIGEHRLSVWLWSFLSQVETDSGNSEQGRFYSELAVEKAKDLGQVILQVVANVSRIHLLASNEDWMNAYLQVKKSEELYLPTDNRISMLYNGVKKLEVLTGLGKVKEVLDYAESYLPFTREADARHHEAIAMRYQGQAYLAAGKPDEAKRALDEAILKLETLESRLELGRALVGRAMVYQAGNRSSASNGDIQLARSIFEECGAALDLKKLERI
jgi:tetratricopeptide (TPR) repeat protein